ncbi:MAG TPA: YggS family pyridoxal phosphate-dependent enzyme [Campylobacterales bacterium]|nr:YggS family pyridoxal phosphate-dependent enzyme [Campylobacterales bacterium]
MNYEKKYDEVLEKIEKARVETNEHQIVKIVAASKYVGSSEIEAMYNIGQRAFGENRVQDMKEKVLALDELPLEWHYIGRIQTNKINAILDMNPILIHSVESFEVAKEIDKRAQVKGMKANILLQINSANEDSKAGITPLKAIDEYHMISELKNINIKGVMSIGAHSDDKKEIEKSFKITYSIFEKLQSSGAKICSMGMSGDYELAVRCGSNMLRLGSVLFKN